MTNRDVAAAEAAELAMLRDQATKRQQELAATVEALAGRLHDSGGLRAWARETGLRAGATAWQAARRTVIRRWQDRRVRRAVLVTAAMPVVAVAAMLTRRQLRTGVAARQRPGRAG